MEFFPEVWLCVLRLENLTSNGTNGEGLDITYPKPVAGEY